MQIGRSRIRRWPWPLAVLMGTLVAAIASAVTVHGQAGPSMTLSPATGPSTAPIAVQGGGFTPGDTVLIEILSGSGETRRLATVTADQTGTFTTTVKLTSSPEEAAGLQFPATVTLMAFPVSSGVRSTETVARAPKATFTVTSAGPTSQQISPDALPRTGTGQIADAALPKNAALVVGLLSGIAAVGLGVWHRQRARRIQAR